MERERRERRHEEGTVGKPTRVGALAAPADVPATASRPQRPRTLTRPDPAAAGNPNVGGTTSAAAGTSTGTTGTPDPRYRFLARFGATILSGGIAAIPMALYHYQAELGLVPQEVWFVGYILAHRWTSALPYPSLRRMSRRTGVSTQMLHRYKQSLIEKGYLVTIARHRPSGGRTSNFYDFSNLFIGLEQMLRRDRRAQSWQPTADETDTLDDEAHPGNEPLDPDELDDINGRGDPGDDSRGPGSVPLGLPIRRGGPRVAVPPSQRLSPLPAGGSGAPPSTPGQPQLIGAGHPLAIDPKRAALSALDASELPGAEPPARPRKQSTKRKTNDLKVEPVEQRGSEPHRARTHALPSLTERWTREPSTYETMEKPIEGNEANEANSEATRSQPFIAVADTARDLVADSDRRHPDAGPAPSASAAAQRWSDAKRLLAQRLSAAAFRAWVEPLELVPTLGSTYPPPGGRGNPTNASTAADPEPAIRLRCGSAFQCEQVSRRYKAAIEEALGAPVELVVAP